MQELYTALLNKFLLPYWLLLSERQFTEHKLRGALARTFWWHSIHEKHISSARHKPSRPPWAVVHIFILSGSMTSHRGGIHVSTSEYYGSKGCDSRNKGKRVLTSRIDRTRTANSSHELCPNKSRFVPTCTVTATPRSLLLLGSSLSVY
jgi:hypothetical protein